MSMASQSSNLESFLSFTTPTVRSQILPKTCMRNLNVDWQPLGKDKIEYFNLGDLWDCYDEWSAYGAGAPILYYGETVVQYYTPYLSAIQIYTAKSISLRDIGEDCDMEFEAKSWSSESEDGKLSRSSSNNSDRTWDVDDMSSSPDGSWRGKDRLGELYIEHFEVDVPFGRVPLKYKIDALSCQYPLLKSFNSCDLAPASWMAVAWYPIYHIPARRNAKDLYASFLTYHTLSSSFEGSFAVDMDNNISYSNAAAREDNCREECNSISLLPFGIATYRMQPRVWLNSQTSDHERITSLMSAADSWLKQLRVRHHDHNFFISHSV